MSITEKNSFMGYDEDATVRQCSLIRKSGIIILLFSTKIDLDSKKDHKCENKKEATDVMFLLNNIL